MLVDILKTTLYIMWSRIELEATKYQQNDD